MAKTWEQIMAEVGKVSEAQTRKDQNELLESRGMTWFEFLQTEEFNEMAKKMAEARAANIVEVLVDAHKSRTELEEKKAARAAAAAEAAKKAAEETPAEAPAEETVKAEQE